MDEGLKLMATQTKPIRGKIARILNTREVAINVGEEHGVERGMLFDILSPKGLGIRDPDTGEELGSVELAKARVKVARVYGKISVARTFRTTRVNVGGPAYSLSLSRLFDPPKWETQYETLRIDEAIEPAADDLDEEYSYVATGDVVVQVLEEEE